MAGPFHYVVFVSRAISHHLGLEFRYTVFALYGMFAYAGLCYRENEMYSTSREKQRVFKKIIGI